MPKPVRDDSGYFENVLSDDDDNDQDVDDGGPILTKELLNVPGDHTVKRTASAGSVRSQISRGSSQFWDVLDIPDEDTLRAVEEAERLHSVDHELEPSQSKWRRADSPKPIETAQLNQPSDPGDLATERRRNEPDDFKLVRGPAQQRKLEVFSGKFEEQVRLTTSPEDFDVFGPASATDARSPIVIAHSERHQRFFDKYNLAWGVQWEIARLVSSRKIQYDDIPLDILKDLAGPNDVAAPLVEKLLLPRKGDIRHRRIYEQAFAKEISTRIPWVELDKEEEALSRDPLSGLGCNSVHDDWYGGKVAFIVHLRQEEPMKGQNSLPQYHLEIDSPELSSSTRFMRRWGSRRFLRVRIPESIWLAENNHLVSYFENNFVVHGRVYRPFYAKDRSVFLFELNSIYTDGHVMPDLQDGKISFEDFLKWHNPMDTNKNQSLAKWCARMALGLSNSAPGVEIAAENVYEIDDLYSPAGQTAIGAGRKPESKDVTTDGSGFTNQATLLSAKQKFNWEHVPSAIQFRLGGGKGLLLLHPDDNGASNEPFRVWIRPSQMKIAYGRDSPPDRAHLILDVLRRSYLKHPARLSAQIIVNLAQNGVSHEVFEGLLKDGLQDIAASLTQWSGQYAMQNLWAAVAAANGSVIRARMSREAAGSSRVLGFSSWDNDDEEPEDEDMVELIQTRSKAWWADEISGCPSTLEETVMVLLDAGFEPQSCAILAMKLKEVFKRALNSYIERYRIIVPRSAEAWIVPDPCGVLGPGEIFLKTSEHLMGEDDLYRDHLLGEVLVTRHPCCVPSDVQKVRAVWRDELRKYSDVIIFSVQGERSLASMLGGGDYDGDTVHVIWEPTIVAAFRKPDDKFADPPPGLDEAFKKDTITVADFLGKYNIPKKHVNLQDYLLASLKNASLVGQYSNWHDVAVYKFGYEHDEAWRLAYMFCAVLDSSKTGKTVRPDVLTRDSLLYKGRRPDWKVPLSEEQTSKPPPLSEAPRRQGKLSRIKFIMDHLKEAAKKEYNHHMAEFEKLLFTSRQQYKNHLGITTAGLHVDPALEAPWLQAEKRAQRLVDMDGQDRLKRELEIIRTHVQAVRERHRDLLRQDKGKGRNGGRPVLSPRGDGASFTNKPIEQRQDILRALSLAFSQMPEEAEFLALSPEEVKRCRASYAYILETQNQERRFTDGSRYSRFPFDVAMRELGKIKAESMGPCNMVNSRFYGVFNVVGAIKAFRPPDSQAYTYSP